MSIPLKRFVGLVGAAQRCRAGTAAIEFAFVGPLLIALMMGIFEFGLILFVQNSSQDAARYVARQLATNRIVASDAASTALPQLPTWVNSSAKVTVTQTTPGTPNTNQFTVDIAIPASSASPTNFFSSIYGSKTLRSKVTMQQELVF